MAGLDKGVGEFPMERHPQIENIPTLGKLPVAAKADKSTDFVPNFVIVTEKTETLVKPKVVELTEVQKLETALEVWKKSTAGLNKGDVKKNSQEVVDRLTLELNQARIAEAAIKAESALKTAPEAVEVKPKVVELTEVQKLETALEVWKKSTAGLNKGDVKKNSQEVVDRLTLELNQARIAEATAKDRQEIVPSVGGDSRGEQAFAEEDAQKAEIVLVEKKKEIVPKTGMEIVVAKIKSVLKLDEQVDKSIIKVEEPENLSIIKVEKNEIIPSAKKTPPATKFRAAVAAAKGSLQTQILYRDEFGHEKSMTLNAKELVFKEAEFFGAMISHNSQEINDPESVAKMGNAERRSKKVLNFFDNMLRSTMTAGMHEGKEQRHAVKLMAAAGVEGGMTNEFFKTVDRASRDELKVERAKKGWFDKVRGDVGNFFNEIRAGETDLHRKRIEITARMRKAFDLNPFDTESPMYEMVMRDVVGREEFARRIGEMPTELLHAGNSENGERRDTVVIEKGSPVDKRLKEMVIMPAIRDILKQYDETKLQPARIGGELRNQLDLGLRDYFFSKEFQEFRASLPADQAAKFDNSLTYATDILAQFEENMIPNIVDNYDYYKSAESSDLEISLTLGTGKYGPNGEIPSSQIFSVERVMLNDETWKILSKRAEGAQNTSPLFGQNTLVNGSRWDIVNHAVDILAKNEFAAAVSGTVLTKAVMGTFHGVAAAIAAPIAVPVAVFFGSGIMAGVKEYVKLRSEHAVVDYEEALGYHRKDNAKRYTEMKLRDYNRIDMSHRAQQFAVLTGKQEFQPTDVVHLMGLIADSQARISISDLHNINLLSASKETPQGRGLYQREERIHGLALSAATAKYTELMANPQTYSEVKKLLGLTDDVLKAEFAQDNANDILDTLKITQEFHLESGTKIDERYLAAFNTAEYQLTQKDGLSVKGRDDAFETWRRKRSLKHGATVGAFAGVFSGAVSGLVTLGKMEYDAFNNSSIEAGWDRLNIPLINHESVLKPIELPNNSMAHIPLGTTLMPDDMHQAGVYDLVNNATHEHLLDNITFDEHGVPQMTSDLLKQAATHHIVESHSLIPEYSGTVDTSMLHDTVTLRFGELPGAPNGDTDSWFAHSLNGSYATTPATAGGINVERVTEINALRELFQGWEQSEAIAGHDHFSIDPIEGVHRIIHHNATTGTSIGEYQAPNAVMTDIPWILGTEQGHRAVADLLRESMQMNADGVELDPLHQAVFDMGYKGTLDTIPTPDEVKLIFDYLNQGTSTVSSHAANDSWFNMTETIALPVNVPHANFHLEFGANWTANLAAVGIGAGYRNGLESPYEEQLKLSGDWRRQAPTQPTPGTAIVPAQTTTPIVFDETVSGRAAKEIKFGEPGVPLNLSEIRNNLKPELVDLIGKNAKDLVIEPDGVQSKKGINRIMTEMADKHKLPVAFLIKDNSVRVLTRPPEVPVNGESKVYFFNATTGKEEAGVIKIDKDGKAEDILYMSSLNNFPAGASDASNGAFVNYELASEYFKSIGYDYSGIEADPDTGKRDGELGWTQDVIASTAFVMAAVAQKQAKSEPPKEGGEGGDEFTKQFEKNIEVVGIDLMMNLGPNAKDNIAAAHEDTVEGNRFIHNTVNEIADSHNVGLAYIMNDNRMRVLTRPPEVVDEGHSKVFYYDPQASAEKELVLETSKEASEKNLIYFTGEKNFPGVAEYKSIQRDHKVAAEFMKKAEYAYPIEHKHEAIPIIEGAPAWLVDVISGISYLMAVKESKKPVAPAATA